MSEEVQSTLNDAKAGMEKSIQHLVNELAKLRAGKASPAMLEGVSVDYYGSQMPLNQVASVNTPDARTIAIQPWEKQMIQPIEKAILGANLGFNPQNDGTLIRINIPPLTEERRRELVKYTHNEGEQAKISIRNFRKEANEKIKKLQKDGLPEDEAKRSEDKVQDLTNNYTAKVDEILVRKEKEIMTV